MLSNLSVFKQKHQLKNSITALVTPFLEDLSIDYESLELLLNHQIKNGTQGILLCGTTGEAATLSDDEKINILDFTVKYMSSLYEKKGLEPIPILFNSGSNNTSKSIELTLKAEKAGADYIMLITPYYNRPSQLGLIKHFTEISQTTKLPICLYNVPSRTSCDLDTSTIIKLLNIDNIVALKDANTDLTRPMIIQKALSFGRSFTLLSGDDPTTLQYLASGGDGCISVSSNVLPFRCQQVHELWNNNSFEEALKLHRSLLEFHTSMFAEPSPVPAKYALSLLGLCQPYVRSPMINLSDNSQQKIKSLLSKFHNV